MSGPKIALQHWTRFIAVLGLLGGVFLTAGSTGAAASTWSVTPSPNEGVGFIDLSMVSCVTSTHCVAVGSFTNASGVSQTLVETWDSGTWSITPSPNQGGNDNELLGVSCTSTTSCVAAGQYTGHGTSSGRALTLVEMLSGTRWSITPSANPDRFGDDSLYSVSCISIDSCVAVGTHTHHGNPSKTLIESWDGTRWSVPASPSPGTAINQLSGVSCTSSDSCMAVGYYIDSVPATFGTLTEFWDGTSWSVISSVNPGTSNQLNAVSCTNSEDCTAVGNYFNGSADQTLIESWDGGNWSMAPSPQEGESTNSLNGVSCSDASDCVAVGVYTDASSAAQTLIESWSGTGWSVTASPNKGSGSNYLNGVSCTGTNCIAMGFRDKGSSATRTLIETD